MLALAHALDRETPLRIGGAAERRIAVQHDARASKGRIACAHHHACELGLCLRTDRQAEQRDENELLVHVPPG